MATFDQTLCYQMGMVFSSVIFCSRTVFILRRDKVWTNICSIKCMSKLSNFSGRVKLLKIILECIGSVRCENLFNGNRRKCIQVLKLLRMHFSLDYKIANFLQRTISMSTYQSSQPAEYIAPTGYSLCS